MTDEIVCSARLNLQEPRIKSLGRKHLSKNNALLMKLSQRGRSRPFSGGRLIYEELSFAENANAGYYSGLTA